MNFKELYDNNRSSIQKALTSMWCSEPNNESQKSYVKQLTKIIGNLFAPDNAQPVVQCMNSYVPVHSVSAENAKALVGKLWQFSFDPYEHQYQCWNTLLKEVSPAGKPMSIVVTTGTGSGKTECFMMPLVYDLLQHPANNEIQALFLYPLNALMEDQKDRLEKFLTGTNITYSVYNSDLPEDVPSSTKNDKDTRINRRKIERITGGKYVKEADLNGKSIYVLKDIKYKHMLYTRKQVRQTPPNILLTNPTMLEYILLRRSDASLIDPTKKSLRWVTIDETHTYSGAGAAELAMLLRRVLLAFNVKAEDIRFATSSATFGNGSDDEKKLLEFIANITGTGIDQIKIVGGKRIGEENIPLGKDHDKWELIFKSDFVELSHVITEGETISEKLQLLDDMCQREEERCKKEEKNVPDMKLKVHYFYRVPNNGLFIQLTHHKDGSFFVTTQNSIGKENTTKAPLLELSRCKNCGEYVAVARVNIKDWTYEPLAAEDNDMFDLVINDDEESSVKYAIFGLSNRDNAKGDNNVVFNINSDGKLQPAAFGEYKPNEWHIVGNTHCCCPYCNHKQGRSSKNDDNDKLGDSDILKLQKFRVSSEFISRKITPSILDQLDKGVSQNGKAVLHEGQQFISFVDSRQAAARATLRQNLEQERLWFYSTIYHELCRRKFASDDIEKEIAECSVQMRSLDPDSDEFDELFFKRKKLKNKTRNYMTWQEIADLIFNDSLCYVFCTQFVNRSSDSDELNKEGKIDEAVIRQYVHSLMVMYLGHRPATAASPETMGLFHACYPQLKKLILPTEVENFNKLLVHKENQITLKDWQDYIQVFLDFSVRNNQSVFLRISDQSPIDIFSSVRFASEKPDRRPVTKPVLEKGKISQSKFVKYLCALIVKDNPTFDIKEAQNSCFDEIEAVINCFWNVVNDPNNLLLEHGTHFDPKTGRHVEDNNDAPRFNLNNLCFQLYEEVTLCDTKSSVVQCLRPVESYFMFFSPYLDGTSPIEVNPDLKEKWAVYPYYKTSGKKIDIAQLNEWAQTNRKLLWENHLWGDEGIFNERLNDIHLFPNLFIQAEHTAQVDKDVARDVQTDFKDHAINVLACSTTMEMGVDLGNLEVVLLSSVPPMPANYKQRAGRSGRNNKVKSVCITLCGSDAIGLRTLAHPIEKIMNRPVNVPTVDLKSPQVIQRHINSFLIREFGVFANGENGGSLNQKVVDFYTSFKMQVSSNGHLVILTSNNREADPTCMLGDSTDTMYEEFNKKCMEPITPTLREDLETLLKDTLFQEQYHYVIQQARETNERCYAELYTKLNDYKFAYENTDKENFRVKLKMQYMEVMNERLLNFWATHRFTPNANMPVNVLSLDLNTSSKKGFFTKNTSSNPSYSLREAIAQYAPGNRIVIDGVVYIVRGISFTNMYQGTRAFKTIYRNADKTVIDDGSILPSKIPWRVNNKEGLELIQPASFLPDMNEDKSRIIENNSFTRVSAQLIDTDDWTNIVTEPHLFSVRSNRDTGNAKILYYNEGKGYGFCFCPRCGRMVLEDQVAESDGSTELPSDFNPVPPKRDPNDSDQEKDKPWYHHAMNGKELWFKCFASNDSSIIKRNVIIGDLIQTDYSEIRIRHKGNKKWISERSNEENLLITLGIVFSQTLVDIIGKERGAVDFAIMPNGHLCIFDTNPGGSGYANQLINIQIMKEVIAASKTMLEEAKRNDSKDMILDKFTLRYLKMIDIEAALNWIQEEAEASEVLPTEIAQIFPKATETSLYQLIRNFSNSVTESTLYVNDNYKEWDYNGIENGWRQQLLNHFVAKGLNTNFCMIHSEGHHIPEPIMHMIREVKAWTKDVKETDIPYKGKAIYPIAYIDDCFYFTNNNEYATLNDKWGNGTLYFVRTKNPIQKEASIDTSYKPSTMLFKIQGDAYRHITTKELGNVIEESSNKLIRQFIDYAKEQKTELTITYQDEHLKSVLGIILALQTIEHFVKSIGLDFSLEFLVEKYVDDRSQSNFASNLPSSSERDLYLDGLACKWIDELIDVKGHLTKIESKERKTLEHWRVLNIDCEHKRLSIYPDGGFVNGWLFDKDKNNERKYSKYYKNDNTDTKDDIPIRRIEDIKYDVAIEDI